MTKYGSQFSATDPLKKASGITHDAGARSFKNLFALAADGGTAEALKIADVAPATHISGVTIETDANLSTMTFTIGTAAVPAKYGPALAGPNATTQVRYSPLAVGIDPNTDREEIFLFPSAAIPSVGTLRVTVHGTKR